VTDALAKLTEVAAATNKNITDLSDKVGDIDKRVTALENKPPPPPQDDSKLKQVQDELDKLREQLKQGGTVRISVLPK
jgi:uncharacterized phage infection (PIP) family protein YhgE